jgi:hypothetical protein
MAQRGKFLFFARAKKRDSSRETRQKKNFYERQKACPLKGLLCEMCYFICHVSRLESLFLPSQKKEISPSVPSLSLSVSLW